MRKLVPMAALLVLGWVAAGPAPAQDAKVQVGGNFEVEVVRNLAYYEGPDADKDRHRLDLYLPKGAKGFPVVVFIHGGGWRNGNKNGFGRQGSTFARNGIGFVSAGYRLSPAVKHPEHIKDVARAFAWTHKHVAEYGGNPAQIFVSGHSAGGHLAALLGTDDSYLKAVGLGLNDVKGVIPISGVFTVRGAEIFGDPESSKAASPLTHVKEKRPPMLMLYASKEAGGLGRQAEQFGAALTKAGCDGKVVMIDDRDHGSIMRNIANEDDPATQQIFAFVSKHAGLKLKPREAKQEGK